MLTTLYILAALYTFAFLSESESDANGYSLTQRQLLIILCASVVWPILAAGLLYEKRREIFENIRTLLDLELDLDQIIQELNPHPELFDGPDDDGYEETEYTDVDPDTL